MRRTSSAPSNPCLEVQLSQLAGPASTRREAIPASTPHSLHRATEEDGRAARRGDPRNAGASPSAKVGGSCRLRGARRVLDFRRPLRRRFDVRVDAEQVRRAVPVLQGDRALVRPFTVGCDLRSWFACAERSLLRDGEPVPRNGSWWAAIPDTGSSPRSRCSLRRSLALFSRSRKTQRVASSGKRLQAWTTRGLRAHTGVPWRTPYFAW